MRNGGFGPVGLGWSAYPAGGRTDYPTCSSWRRTHIDWAVPDSRLQSSPPVRVPLVAVGGNRSRMVSPPVHPPTVRAATPRLTVGQTAGKVAVRPGTQPTVVYPLWPAAPAGHDVPSGGRSLKSGSEDHRLLRFRGGGSGGGISRPGERNRLGRRVPRDRLGTAREVEGVVVPAPLAYRRIRSPRECPALRQHRWMSSDTTPGCCAGAVVVVVLIHADLGGPGCACCAGTWCHAKEERDGDRHHGNGRRETIPTHRHDRRRDGDQPADSATLEHPSGPQISPGSRDAVTESNKPSALAIFERELRRLAARVGPPP
jgi:hypothetical protein